MRICATLFALALALVSADVTRAQTPVDVELVIAVDVSRSMSPRELEIQRRGYAEALVSERVVAAMLGGYHRQVALLYVEWAGTASQRIVVDWSLIRSRTDAEAFAAKLTAHFIDSMRRTSISGALDFAAGLFDGYRYRGDRRVIDISGDGPNNDGRIVTVARDAAVARGIVINGLPLMTREGMGARWHLADLDLYYYHCVIGGPGAFVVPVLEWEHFPEAVRRKLELELAGVKPLVSPQPQVVLAAAGGYDCLIGEKIWDSLIDEP